jgi:molybdopterin converting factor small subunit
MVVKIILFGRLAEIAGNSVWLEDVSDTDSLKIELQKHYPEMAHTKYVIAVNKRVVNENTLLSADSVVALLPPFSGG